MAQIGCAIHKTTTMKTPTITIPQAEAETLYKLLGQQLNPQPELPTKWEDILSFETACLVVPPTEDQLALLAYSGSDKNVRACVAVMKLTIVSAAMNKLANGGIDWNPDWSNGSEYKYYAYLQFVAGSGFSYCDFVFDDSYSTVGSRLCFRSGDMARHAATHFAELYNDFFNL